MSREVRRRSAALVTVVVLVATTACGIPTASSPTAIAKANVPFHLLNPTSSTITSSLQPTVTVPESIYLVAAQHVVAATRDVPVPATLAQVLTALLDGPTSAESSAGLQSFLVGTGVRVTTSVVGGIATVNFSSNPVQVVGPNQTLAIAQIVFTATAQTGVIGVSFQIAGKPIDVPTASGAQVPGPVNGLFYVPQAPAS